MKSSNLYKRHRFPPEINFYAVLVRHHNGDHVFPISLSDDDPDNHVIACLAEASPAVSVSVIAGFFYGPDDDANPETSIHVSPIIIQ